MKNTVRYKNGNNLSYMDCGEGEPILIQHGMIASIDEYHLFQRLIRSRKRLICIARPGYGESSPYVMQNLVEWGEIVSVLVDKLKLSKFDVLGMSSGAPYSYAIAYKLPERARNIFIFSGIPALYDDEVVKDWPYEVNRDTTIPAMQKLAHEIFFPNVTAEELLKSDVRDSMMNNCFGIAQDLKIRCIDWGFTLSNIEQPVFMEHSRTDPNVPFITAERTSKLLPHCHLTTRDGEHFSDETLDNFLRNAVLRNHS